MPLIAWDQGFSVGVGSIDEQHKKLIGLLNDLHDAMRFGKGRDVLGKVLAELIDYTAYHFRTEEGLFAKYGPDIVKYAHKRFLLTSGEKMRFDRARGPGSQAHPSGNGL